VSNDEQIINDTVNSLNNKKSFVLPHLHNVTERAATIIRKNIRFLCRISIY